MDISTKVLEAEQYVEHTRSLVEMSKKVERLKDNEDFKDIILETLLGSSLRELAISLTDPLISDTQEMKVIHQIKTLRSFKVELEDFFRKASSAKSELIEAKELLAQVLNEKE